MKVFLDTNVILDVLAGRQPFFADSQRVMTFCELAFRLRRFQLLRQQSST
jgi:hypothetical protein